LSASAALVVNSLLESCIKFHEFSYDVARFVVFKVIVDSSVADEKIDTLLTD